MEKIISWIEIPTENFERAVTFYNAVMDWNLTKSDFGQEKMACLPNDEGAIISAPGFKPSQNGVLVSFNAGNRMDFMIQKIVKNGGQMVKPKTKIEAENRAYFSVFRDSEGNTMGLYGN